MYFINVGAFIDMEGVMGNGGQVDTRTKVLEYCDDEATVNRYAILSHRWTRQEVNYVEITGLAKMSREDRNDIRRRDGYQKIYYSCLQAKEDGYASLWVDTCCIDKRSSAELSEAINSMYRWYENSTVCYVYLHDVHGSSLPTEPDTSGYPDRSKEWPEWFSRGWTLQEMIAPNNVRFFNRHWVHIGDKKTHAHTLAAITGVPEHILTDGLSSNRPCIAQIMSWAAKRMTTRVEDRAYSLLGLLDVNMPMLYGEGKKAFHRLQLEIIRMSNDQSIFAWDWSREVGRTGSILADCPSCFEDCSGMELMKSEEFTQSLKDTIREEDKDRFGVFPITNRGIQIWLLLSPCGDSTSVFKARLPCRSGTSGSPVTIDLALWESNYYRYFTSRSVGPPGELVPQFRQVYLRYQDTLHHAATFEIDDSVVIKSGFTYCGSFPSALTEKVLTLTSNTPPHIFIYSDSNTRRHFAVGFGQCFGQDWVHFTCEKPTDADNGQPIWEYAVEAQKEMLIGGPEHARSMAEAWSGKRHSRLCIKQVHLPKSEWTVRTSCIVWERSRGCGIKLEVFRDRGANNGQDKWTGFDVERVIDPNRDMRSLMIRHNRSDCPDRYILLVDSVSMEFVPTPNVIKLGDYGRYILNHFRHEGNILTDLESHSPMADITPQHHKIDSKDGRNYDHVKISSSGTGGTDHTLYKPLGRSLPTNHDFNSFLASRSSRLANKHLVTWVVQCDSVDGRSPVRFKNSNTPLCIIAKPLVWHRDIYSS